MYTVYYTADELMDTNGDELPVDFDVNVFCVANRFIWVSNKKIFGADFFVNGTIPLLYTDIEIGAAGIDQDKFGVSDINFEPVGLAWHGPRYDAVIATGVYLPVGEYDADDNASPGKGYTTFMTNFGGTLYLDAERTWSVSILGRYEIHTEQDDQDLTPGDDFHFEWGIGKSFAKVWEAGLAGYCQWQVSDDSGDDAVNPDEHDSVYGIGPEIGCFVPAIKSFFLSYFCLIPALIFGPGWKIKNMFKRRVKMENISVEMEDGEEYVVIVDEKDKEIGIEKKLTVHSENTPLHRAFSLFLFNTANDLLLQQRSGEKKTWPLVWSNSCCGHPLPNESYENAVIRRTLYELGVNLNCVEKISDYRYCFSRDGIMENEICPVFIAFYDGKVVPNCLEVQAIKWIKWEDWLKETTENPDRYSPWCVEETWILASARDNKINAFKTQGNGSYGLPS